MKRKSLKDKLFRIGIAGFLFLTVILLTSCSQSTTTKTVIITTKLQPFTSSEQLITWFNQQPLLLQVSDNSNNSVDLTGACYNIALGLQNEAIRDGYLLNLTILTPADYQQYYGQTQPDYHAICYALIGNQYWICDKGMNKCWCAEYLNIGK